jgi:hypothetical protein
MDVNYYKKVKKSDILIHSEQSGISIPNITNQSLTKEEMFEMAYALLDFENCKREMEKNLQQEV